MKKLREMKKARSGETIDRISGLPDSILCLILSFIDTKSAIQTSALSRRWRSVWTSLPSLDFRYSNSLFEGKRARSSFSTFVEHVLALRDSSKLDAFSFSVRERIDPVLVETCIRYALRHSVRELRIRAYCRSRPVEMPPELVSCQSLVLLKLVNATSNSLVLPKTLALPCLRTLHLKKFFFSDRNFNGEIFSGCPNLESLILSKCAIRHRDNLMVLKVSGQKLKNLEILNWRCPWAKINDQGIVVSAPRLASFNYKGLFFGVRFKDPESLCLDNVSINLCFPGSCATFDPSDRLGRTAELLAGMLGELSNARSLTLSLKTIEILSAIHNIREFGPSTFGNLRHLRFKAENKYREMAVSIGNVANLLNCSMGRTSLVLDLPEDHELSSCGDVESPKVIAGCKGKNSIVIPTQVMCYLLQSSPCAENIVIEFPEAAEEE